MPGDQVFGRSARAFSGAFCCVAVLLLAACAGDSSAPPASSVPGPPKVEVKARYYVVKKGDTLSGIGAKTGYQYRQLAVWNQLEPPYTIFPGQIIRLFPSSVPVQARTSKSPVEKRSAQRKKSGARKRIPVAAARKEKSVAPSPKEKAKKELKVSWKWPLKGVIVRNYSQTGQKGIDISGKPGQPVRAAAAGKVVYSGRGLVGYGNLVIVKHDERFLSAYGNNRRLLVKEGDRVEQGQKIAEVGAVAGKQPSLHFEIRKDGKAVDPVSYLPGS